ncbi:MAG: DNA-formamidopyrimidine glycosylase [Acidobacteriia bacterium 12-62-4]|nr:MAG: DNA-formamidopyrimidine glycosylase [Acidobacteriia bacterium 12-62-4]
MPELPEVETIVRALAPRLQGERIVGAEYWPSRVFRGELPPDLKGAQVIRVRRHGKFVVADMDRGFLGIHLGMTGKLLFDVAPHKHTRAVWEFAGFRLSLEDIRQFGRVLWGEQLPESIAALGPDPLEVSREEFIERARQRRMPIKALLLNQRVLRGMGNIYTDELLFRARLHPAERTDGLSRTVLARTWEAMRGLLEEAIAKGGSSISDYVNTAGEKGTFQLAHRVYAREGEPCLVCGSPIERIVLLQRGTHFCPRCQRR